MATADPLQPGMIRLAPIALLALAACVSSKEQIERSLDETDRGASSIIADARAGEAELETVQALDLPDGARPPIKSAEARFGRIAKDAEGIQESVDNGREGLKGVINKPTPLWRKALYAGLALLALFTLLVYLAPSLLVRAIPSLAGVLGRARRSGATLLAEGKVTEAVAAMRASDPRFDAAWRAARR